MIHAECDLVAMLCVECHCWVHKRCSGTLVCKNIVGFNFKICLEDSDQSV